eukprot:NODE_7236_length_412_cov_16.228650_g5593_i0.p1 GENE.NODE_7236_length_412_cov_16.228650_g5593_i0~~NODE_7236_length_412_cov_16.228650_g5593_i0.p1  ORF type:complete len:67 (+),score=5.23 NODE_7236_length_412_cov_16.228650_g5593_i0:144-344(+)
MSTFFSNKSIIVHFSLCLVLRYPDGLGGPPPNKHPHTSQKAGKKNAWVGTDFNPHADSTTLWPTQL